MISAVITSKGGKNILQIQADIGDLTPSKSGKSLIAASTHGNVVFPECKLDGKPVTISVNAYIKL